ncbi:MAG: hypothetical protein ACLTMP_09275 [Eggerthella lenta]
MGEAQIETLIARLRADGRGGEAHPVRIHRETIRKTAEAQGRHKKQTGGAGSSAIAGCASSRIRERATSSSTR